jgi:hypothetical protein
MATGAKLDRKQIAILTAYDANLRRGPCGCGVQDFVYAVEMNHRKERLLNGAALEAVASRPAMLITGPALTVTISCRSAVHQSSFPQYGQASDCSPE